MHKSHVMIAPIVLFLDDGPHIFKTVAEGERWLEAEDVRMNPDWRGYDSQFAGLALKLENAVTKTWGINASRLQVRIFEAEQYVLDRDLAAREALLEALMSHDPQADTTRFQTMGTRELLSFLIAQREPRNPTI